MPPFFQSDLDFPEGHSLLFLFFFFFFLCSHPSSVPPPIAATILTLTIYCFVCLDNSWLSHPHQQIKQASPLKAGAEVKQCRAWCWLWRRWRDTKHIEAVIMSAEMPEGIQHCIAILVRWEISHDESKMKFDGVIDSSGWAVSLATNGEVGPEQRKKHCKIKIDNIKHPTNKFKIWKLKLENKTNLFLLNNVSSLAASDVFSFYLNGT